MIKTREARYCNLKLLLIFLVIYGHLIELQIDKNIIISIQYKFIYLFHMPAFAFLSGLFIRDYRSCALQLKKTMPLYVGLQVLTVVGSGGTVDFISPCWILWYLMSLSWWLCFAWWWLRFAKGKGRIVILIAAILAGCIAGHVGFIDRRFSISRTLVFFPYFWLGLISDWKTEWKKYRIAGMTGLLFSVFLFTLSQKHLTADFLYHAEPYGIIQNGAVLRLACYIMGVPVILFLLAWIPDKRLLFTKAGADTMPAYLLHAILIALFKGFHLPWYVCPVVTVTFLWMICRITQLKGAIYRINSSERREERCPVFTKYMKKMRESCMDFCSLSPETKC